jgi:hypothetical protein
MTDAKEERGELDQDEVTATVPGLFKSRLRGKDVKIGDTIFTVEGLPSLMSTMITGDATDKTGFVSDAKSLPGYLRYGIKKIKGLQDESGKDVKFEYDEEEHYGKKYKCVPWDILDGIGGLALVKVYRQISWLTHLTKEDHEKADFILASSEKTSVKVDGEEAQ